MKLFEVLDDFIDYDDSTPMKLAKDIYRGSGGDVEKAKAMANLLRQQILKNIDKHHKMATMQRVGGEQRNYQPEPDLKTGYEQEPEEKSTFNASA